VEADLSGGKELYAHLQGLQEVSLPVFVIQEVSLSRLGSQIRLCFPKLGSD
jgi:hypothetical protein